MNDLVTLVARRTAIIRIDAAFRLSVRAAAALLVEDRCDAGLVYEAVLQMDDFRRNLLTFAPLPARCQSLAKRHGLPLLIWTR
jgi:hypothetical protein